MDLRGKHKISLVSTTECRWACLHSLKELPAKQMTDDLTPIYTSPTAQDDRESSYWGAKLFEGG